MSSSSTAPAPGITGLSSEQAEAALRRSGPNELAATSRHSLIADVGHAFENPLVIVLIIAAAISAFVGQRVDAAIIAIMVVLSTTIDLAQSYRSQSAVDKLRAQVSPT